MASDTSKSPNKNVSIVFPTMELKEAFEADARRAGRRNSEHGYLIIASHLEGKSLDQVHEEMSELTSELARFRQSFDQHRRAVFFSLVEVIGNMPNGAEAAKIFEDCYQKAMTQEG